ncbi:MAG TPA: SGNH/GDSL hydrolase family protein, partial [Prosthecobacter sp.]|nr:SGNH/GDSL hydrolase family protein [Prosthecobacter sp.]
MNAPPDSPSIKKHRPWTRRVASLLLQGFIILVVTGLFVEVGFRVLESRSSSKYYYEGKGGIWMDDSRWGWKPTPGPFKMGTPEFEVTGDVNDMFMNEPPVDMAADAARTRVMVLGDSHTFATGVSREQTWPSVLEQRLNSGSPSRFAIYNAATTGYNLHQYLLRLKDQGPVLKPHYVVLGLSYATDFYDLLPPDHGGWIYGGDKTRDHFDLDANGVLQERHWEKPATAVALGQAGGMVNTTPQMLRQFLDNFATFRFLRRSKLALMLGSKLRIGGQSLWPNMEVIVEKDPSKKHLYQHRLFEALLLEISKECKRQNATLVVVGIPYLPQVYDDLWNSTFGGDPRFDRSAAIERVSALCGSHGITYVDTLAAFQSRHKELGRWLHHRQDAHPTAEGQ